MKNCKFLLFAMMTVILAACDTNRPEIVKSVPLSDTQTAYLDAIFDDSNELLKEYPTLQAVIIRSNEEFCKLCSDDINCPSIDFSQSCIIFAPIDLSSVNDKIIGCTLYHNVGKDLFEYKVEIQKCTECYHVIDHVYAYGVYSIPADKIKQITPLVQLLYR